MVLQDLRRFVATHRTQSEAAKSLGISRGQLNDILKGRQPFGTLMQQRLYKALHGESEQEVLDKAQSQVQSPFGIDLSGVNMEVYDAFVFAGTPGMVFDAPSSLFPTKGRFLVQVKGDSMINAGIMAGDMLIVSKTHLYASGNIVIARIEDTYTVKRIKNGNGLTLLNPDNPEHEPIVVAADTDWECIGIVEYVVRKPN
jgi:phage repressor protein C with HTH and peptisase S24 domain